ncbi:hypothetical protein J4N45_14595 [Vibrio sp. SCSIO 43140]|uniref:hypothetical protein n=1 Tax=Vibrio sp. SCSIO 43140 TaxID=2819100 RepID=UPI002076499F|nr:hypothetical protein [Vibrio sp. SCSIO 43140]USD58783.1 hypothetical protein J4N45_09590 [Vibrio sp. SCSIO 43140]USD59117.1 hypothetical protein J4N45_11295 [Vibrio sp. SCSIO 43140]USD59729.1 hypothetical protein J4N45_14595 [Vibrio sp. SCSIO 43140]
MKQSTKINAIMHNLLIEKGMDDFSVIELRDAYLSTSECKVDPDEARRKVYRQILRFMKNNWLGCKGEGRQRRYFQTDLFHSLYVTPRSESAELATKIVSDYSVLVHERNQYKGELEIVLGEIDEYQSLLGRFPELEKKLRPLLEQAREHSAQLLGKVNVLTKVLKTLMPDNRKC